MPGLSGQATIFYLWIASALPNAFGMSEPASLMTISSLESRQSDTVKCPKSYTARNGLNFTTYCNQDIPKNDVLGRFTQNSMFDCMGHCSRYQGKGEGCFGVVWSESHKLCWLKNSTITSASIGPKSGYHSAMIVRSEMSGYNTSCPNEDSSVNSVLGVEDMKYITHCGKYIEGDDECFSGYPCLQGQFIGFFHAESLEQCVRICTDQHPLCKAVSWNPGLELGFANCRPRTTIPQIFGDPGSDMGIMHAAAIPQINQPDQDCPPNSTYITRDARNRFDIRCGQLSTGTNITAVHTQNITACMNACVSSGPQCVGAVYDSSLAWGYNNCYLQNTTNLVVDQASATYLVRSKTQDVSESSNPGNTDVGKGSSKIWITGPVIGAFVFIAAVCCAVLWFRRRGAATGAPMDGNLEKNGEVTDQVKYASYCEAPATAAPVELGVREVGELS